MPSTSPRPANSSTNIKSRSIDKQLVDLKNFSSGEPSSSASGIRLNKNYDREPIEVQIRALQDKKKDLQSKIDALLDEARKKGVDPGQLR